MSYSVEEFLEQHFAALSEILTQAAADAGGHYAEMSPSARRLNAEHDTVEFIHALSEGHADRQAARLSGARPTNTGLIADDLLRLSRLVEPRVEDYFNAELANHPVLRDELVRRLHQVQASYRASLTGVKIDQVLTHFSQQIRRSS